MRFSFLLLLSLFSINISLAQSGWGYVNYTSYRTHNGNGSTNQYGQFANSATDFTTMFNTNNSNTTIFRTGEVTLQAMASGSSTVPRWGSDYFGYKFEFWFIPQETGLYYFGINSDDASDLFIDGVAVATYYGGHGASAYQIGGINMVAGRRYSVVARMQEYGGGEAFFFQWLKPSQIGGWGYWNNEVTNVAIEPTKKARINLNFGSTLDETKFSIGSALSSTGWVDVTNLIDSNKVVDGNKGTIVNGQVEWSYITPSTNSTILNIDLRTFGATSPSSVTNMKILNLYDGPVVYQNSNIYWAIYTIPKVISPTVGSGIRDMGNGSYAFTCDITYTTNMSYKPQTVTVSTTNNMSTLYGSILTVSDVYLAFKELVNTGIFGDQSGNEFTYGIQYKNADVNDDGTFNEADCFALLQHLTGKKNIVDVFNLTKTLKLIPQATYNTISKSNWSSYSSFLGDMYGFNINTGNAIDTFYVSGTWKGDVNLSHSGIPVSNGVTTNSINFNHALKSMTSVNTIRDVEADIMMEKNGDNIITTINVTPNENKIGAIQFDVYYDNSILEFSSTKFIDSNSINFDKNNESFVSVGTLNTSGGSISNLGYILTFKPKTPITNLLGLISVKGIEAISVSSNKINIKIL